MCVNYAVHADAAEALVAEITTAGGRDGRVDAPKNRRASRNEPGNAVTLNSGRTRTAAAWRSGRGRGLCVDLALARL